MKTKHKGLTPIIAIILLITMFLVIRSFISSADIYKGYATCVSNDQGLCNQQDIQNNILYDKIYLAKNTSDTGNTYADTDLRYLTTNVNYELSTCEISLNTNPLIAGGDPCDQTHCVLKLTSNLVETPLGPGCVMPSRNYWTSHISDANVNNNWCCEANPSWTMNNAYGVNYIKFNIVQQVVPSQQPPEDQPPLGDQQTQPLTWYQSIFNWINNFFENLFRGI